MKTNKLSPFDFLNSINFTKEDLMVGEDEEKQYNSFMVCRGLSYFPDTVVIANEMNRYHNLDKKLQYHFLKSIIRKRKRFSKWAKSKSEDSISSIMEFYGYSRAKAESVVDLFSEEDILSLKRKLLKGGKI